MSAINNLLQYDNEFVGRSNYFHDAVNALRVERNTLDAKYSALSTKRSDMLMSHKDLAEITRQMSELQVERTGINSRIDAILISHRALIEANTHANNRLTA